MLSTIVDVFWLLGTAASAAAVAYGGFLVYDFHCRATETALRTVARLALFESARDLTADDDGHPVPQ